LATRGQLLAQFVPHVDGEARYDPIDGYYMPLGRFNGLERTGHCS
jgi:hypothetical protein